MGEPDRPRVVMDSRRCWLAWVLLPVCWPEGLLLCLEKRSVNGRPAKEPRRGRFSDAGTEMGEVERSLDMMTMEVLLLMEMGVLVVGMDNGDDASEPRMEVG